MIQRLIMIGFIAGVLGFAGCGYTFQGAGSALPPDVQRIAIPQVVNNTTEGQLGSVLTEALRDQFERFGVITVVDEARDADAVLTARIVKLERSTDTVASNTDTALQQDTAIIMAAELNRTDGRALWRNSNIRISKSYGTTSDVVVTSSVDFAGGSLGSGDLGGLSSREISRGQEQDALTHLAEEAAKQIYNQAVVPDF